VSAAGKGARDVNAGETQRKNSKMRLTRVQITVQLSHDLDGILNGLSLT